MGETIKIGIAGYGNLGKGTEAAIAQQPDMELVAVFTRRDPQALHIADPHAHVVSMGDVKDYQNKIDVMIVCGGSATDLPEQVPALAKYFNTVDSFDTHAKIPEYFKAVDEVAVQHKQTSIISIGWDPGLFSLNRVMQEAVLPQGETYTFWGKGLSQGHSDAVRRLDGVKNGVQYTIPSEAVIEQVRNGEKPAVSKTDRHTRECFIVPEDGADTAKIEHEIKTMPNYFDEYETTVHFITEDELKQNHANMPHGGFVIRSGETGAGDNQIVEFSLKLDSNPGFTSSVLVAYARAAYRLHEKGDVGAKTIYDVAPGLITPKTPEELRKDYL